MAEMEAAWMDLSELTEVAKDEIKFIVSEVLKHNKPELEFLKQDVKKFIERTSYVNGVRYNEKKNKDMTVITSSNFVNPFFAETAYRMFFAWSCHKIKDYDKALAIASEISALDWRKASIEWLERRKERWELENK